MPFNINFYETSLEHVIKPFFWQAIRVQHIRLKFIEEFNKGKTLFSSDHPLNTLFPLVSHMLSGYIMLVKIFLIVKFPLKTMLGIWQKKVKFSCTDMCTGKL